MSWGAVDAMGEAGHGGEGAFASGRLAHAGASTPAHAAQPAARGAAPPAACAHAPPPVVGCGQFVPCVAWNWAFVPVCLIPTFLGLIVLSFLLRCGGPYVSFPRFWVHASFFSFSGVEDYLQELYVPNLYATYSDKDLVLQAAQVGGSCRT